jgi:hypothetical protein
VIVEQEVVAGSAYEPEEGPVPARVLEHAGELMDREFCPDDVWTLDLCESDGRILVVETNSFSGAGLYQCDMDTVVRAVSRIIERDWAGSRIAVG